MAGHAAGWQSQVHRHPGSALTAGGRPPREAHQIGRRRSRQPATIKPRQNINPIQLSLAHQHHPHRIPSLQTP